MGNLGMPELLLIMIVALLVFGPKKLPELGKQLGRALGEFKRASNDLKRTLEEEVEKATQVEEASTRASQVSQPPPASQPPAPTATAAPEVRPADGAVAASKEPGGPVHPA